MVQVQRFLTRKNDGGSDNNPLPLLNSLFINNFASQSLYPLSSEENKFKHFMKWARRSPQLMGFANIIATDILSDSIEFTPIEDRYGGKVTASGRNRIKRAREFWSVNKCSEVIESSIYDLLFCGNAYNWVGKLDERELREACRLTVCDMEKGLEAREMEFRADQLFEKLKNGEISSMAKKLRHIAATSVTIKYDAHSPTAYVQTVGIDHRIFSPEEIIKFTLMPMDGQPYGYAPMEAILSEVYLLWLISQNYTSYFENGGHPDKVFILPKEIANSRNHAYLVETLKKYKKIQNKHGNLVFTGDLKVEDLMQAENQMQYKDLGLYLVGTLAMIYGIPVARIPFLIGKAANSGDSGGLADSGYWRKISVWQSKLEEGYNSSLWNPYFGVDFSFRRGYLQDEVREVSTTKMKNDIAQQRIQLGLWTVETAGKYLGIDSEEIASAQEQKKRRDVESSAQSVFNQVQGKLKDVMWEPDKQNVNARRSETQKKNQQDAGGKKVNP